MRIPRAQQCRAWRPGAGVGHGGADGPGTSFSFTFVTVALALECDLASVVALAFCGSDCNRHAPLNCMIARSRSIMQLHVSWYLRALNSSHFMRP
jgi:hypothetical protein